jgi:hypothetical protein
VGLNAEFSLRSAGNAISWPDVLESRLPFFCCAALRRTKRNPFGFLRNIPPGCLTKILLGCLTRGLQGQNEGVNVTEGCFSKMDLDADGVISKWEFEAFCRFPSRSSPSGLGGFLWGQPFRLHPPQKMIRQICPSAIF